MKGAYQTRFDPKNLKITWILPRFKQDWVAPLVSELPCGNETPLLNKCIFQAPYYYLKL